MALSVIVIEEHARRTVELAHDNALGAVDDERAALSHERDLAEVHNVFLESAEVASSGLWVNVPENELDSDAQWRRPVHPTVAAFVHVVLRSTEVIRNELKGCCVVVVSNREDRLENLLKTDVFALLRLHVGLEEPLVRAFLYADKVWDFCYLTDSGVALAETEVGLDFRCHT